MKKTINVNIGGFVFHLDEDAYETVQKYLDTLRRYFQSTEGVEDILQDIQTRMAEIFKERLGTTREVVTLADVEYMTGIMGQPEAYMDEQPATPETPPQASEANKGPKRLYRDPDNKVVGGVCSGLGAYFNVDPVIFRVAFALLTLVWGTSVLVYIILWIAMPEAKTTAEKLQMKGEKINVSNIQKSIKDELNSVRQSITGNKQKTKLGQTFEEMVEAVVGAIGVVFRYLGKGLTFLFKALGKGFTIFFMILALALLAGFAHLFFFGGQGNFGMGDHHVSLTAWQMMSMLLDDSNDIIIGLTGAMLFILIPLMMMIYAGIKLLFGIKRRSRWLGIGMGAFWFIGLLLCMYTGMRIGQHYSQEDQHTTEQQIPVGRQQTLVIRSMHPDKDTLTLKAYSEDEKEKLLSWDNVFLTIERNQRDSLVRMEIIRSAHGRTRKEAGYYAEKVIYQMQQQDSLVTFSPLFYHYIADKYRAREVHLKLFLPDEQKIYLDKSIEYISRDIPNVHRLWSHQVLGKTWIMKQEGLTCQSCTPDQLIPYDEEADEEQAHESNPE